MAHGERLRNAWKKIKAFFQKIDAATIHNIDFAIAVTTKLRDAFHSNVAVIVTDLIKGDWDDHIRINGAAILDATVAELLIVKDCMQLATPEEKIKCLFDSLKNLPPLLQNSAFAKLAST